VGRKRKRVDRKYKGRLTYDPGGGRRMKSRGKLKEFREIWKFQRERKGKKEKGKVCLGKHARILGWSTEEIQS